MTLVQLTPIEVRELDLNIFRLTLKDLEDNAEGIIWPDTHVHVPPAAISGIELARQVLLVNGYTVTFEDGQYAVNLIGANTNLQDAVNINQVSVRTSNSAGLVQTREIQYSAFAGAVWIDQANGTSSTIYPAGTPLLPVSTVEAARFIAVTRGFETFHVIGDMMLDTGDDISYFKVIGQNAIRTLITVMPGAVTDGVEIQDSAVTGTLDGGTLLKDCFVFDLDYVDGYIQDCELSGTITLSSLSPTQIHGCYAGVSGPTIDFNGTTQPMYIHGWYGDLSIANRTTTATVEIYLAAGEIELLPSVTTGVMMHLGGVGTLNNLSGIIPDKLMTSPAAVWSYPVEGTVTAAQSLQLANAANAGKTSGMDGTTVKLRNLADTKDRVTATVDDTGRTNVVTDLD